MPSSNIFMASDKRYSMSPEVAMGHIDPLPTVTKIGSCRSPGMRRMGKPTFVMPSVYFHLNFGCAAVAVIGWHDLARLPAAAY